MLMIDKPWGKLSAVEIMGCIIDAAPPIKESPTSRVLPISGSPHPDGRQKAEVHKADNR